MESQKSNVKGISWKRDTDNQGGWSWGGIWAYDGAVISQTEKATFSTSAKIPQFLFDMDGDLYRFVWWAELKDFEDSSEFSYVRTSILVGGEQDVETATKLIEDSTITIYLYFRKTSE